MTMLETPPVADHLDGIKEPFENVFFCGQENAERRFLTALNSGRLHHAWLLSGPKGVGKASFAFRIARALVEWSGGSLHLTPQDLDQASQDYQPVFRKIAQGAHPNLLHLTIPYDEKTKKFKTELPVSEIRKTNGFFGTTAGENGWRITVVDKADDMNANAANALLKILEEPPEKTLFFLITDKPEKLLPTIRSRCQKLDFDKLGEDDLLMALKHAQNNSDFQMENLPQFQSLANGSIRQACLLLNNDILPLYENFNALVTDIASENIDHLYAFMDKPIIQVTLEWQSQTSQLSVRKWHQVHAVARCRVQSPHS